MFLSVMKACDSWKNREFVSTYDFENMERCFLKKSLKKFGGGGGGFNQLDALLEVTY